MYTLTSVTFKHSLLVVTRMIPTHLEAGRFNYRLTEATVDLEAGWKCSTVDEEILHHLGC